MSKASRAAVPQRMLTTLSQPIILVLACALALRLLLWAQPLHQPANDEVEYIAVARDLLAGRGWIFYDTYRWLRAPLYPLFLAGSLWLANGDLQYAALPNLILSVVNVGLAYRLARRLVGPRPALLTAVLTALLWTNATFASLYMAETLFTCLFSAALITTLHIPNGHHPLRWTAAAGVLYGLAALTRSVVLPFIPMVAAWIWLAWPRSGPHTRSRYGFSLPPQAKLALLLLVATVLTIAPWSIRNQLAYGRIIPIETGLSYNLWAFNEPHVELDSIHRTLEAIPNPAERADYATAQGVQRLCEDPAILTRKIWPNWVFLTRVKPIQDRFLMESYYDSIELPLFIAAILFDDGLYIIIVLAAIGSIIMWPHRRSGAGPPPIEHTCWQSQATLMVAWMSLAIGTFLLTHGEARYRHLLYPILIPYAAACLWNISNQGAKGRVRGSASQAARPTTWLVRPIIAIILTWMFCWNIATSYPYPWAAENIVRGWHTLIGDLARRVGQPQAAMIAYRAAADSQRAPDPLLRLGDTARAAGDTAAALSAYRAAQRMIPAYVPAAARLGDLLRALGDLPAARAAFSATYIDQQALSDWSWRNLRPAPLSSLDIGGGLDIGYTNGLYASEILAGATARWSGPRASIRIGLPIPGQHSVGSPRSDIPAPAILVVRLAAPHPTDLPEAAASTRIQICTSQHCQSLDITSDWRTYRIATSMGASEVITISAPTFLAADGRRLGLRIDQIDVLR